MNYVDDNNPHRTETKYSQRIYWKDGHACGKDDNPDRIELTSLRRQWPTLDFAMPRQAHELGRVEALMADAYERGRADAKRAIGDMFKELISL